MTGARGLALEALRRIDTEGAYANLVVPALLDRSDLDDRDRAFVTELVYGVTRMRRSLDHRIDGFLHGEVTPDVRSILRLGAYQLHHLATPPHAAVSATVDLAPRKVKGLVNAVLRRVADHEPVWPDQATRLSYPDWIVERLTSDLGADEATAALERMNVAATVSRRADGYVQDPASRLVVDVLDPRPGERVADVCAAPGGKATDAAGRGALVTAGDVSVGRLGLVAANRSRLGLATLALVVADAVASPHPDGSFDAVLVDAPCSGLGALRRRPDARWRIEADAVERLADLQGRILAEAARLVRPGGRLVYSVCTLTEAESIGVASTVPSGFVPEPVGEPWRPWGSGGLLLPHDADTDGMCVFAWRRHP